MPQEEDFDVEALAQSIESLQVGHLNLGPDGMELRRDDRPMRAALETRLSKKRMV